MSDTMTSIEIEDVLSSIRRLVSEDLRPTHKLVSAALHNNASKLILTPALRIVPDLENAVTHKNDAVDARRDFDTVPEIEDESDHSAAEIIPVFGSIRQMDAIDWAGQDRHIPNDSLPPDANFLATAMSRINVAALDQGEQHTSNPNDTIEAVVAVVGAAVGPDEWEPDGGEPAPQDQAWADMVWNSSEIEATSVDLVINPVEAGVEVAVAQQKSDFEVVSENVPAVPDAIIPIVQGDVSVGTDRIVFRDGVPETGAEDVDGVSSKDPRHDDSTEFSDLLSEDVLREIVRDMIREELQGNLGERITRNVRKLVRAEINRALASHNFDDVANR